MKELNGNLEDWLIVYFFYPELDVSKKIEGYANNELDLNINFEVSQAEEDAINELGLNIIPYLELTTL